MDGKPPPPMTSDEAGQLVVGQRIVGIRARFGAKWLRPQWDGEEHCFGDEAGVEILLANGAILHTVNAPIYVDRPTPVGGVPPDPEPVWRQARGVAPSLYGMSAEEAIRRGRGLAIRRGEAKLTPKPQLAVAPFWGRWWQK